MVIGDLPVNCARRYPNRDATVFKGSRKTFKQFNESVNQMVNVFYELGLRKGDKVSVLSRNNSEILEICFACAKAGIVYVPLNFRLTTRELEFVINDAEVNVLLTDQSYFDNIKSVENNLKIKHLFSLDDLKQLIKGRPTNEPRESVSPTDLFAIFYTSGTTGNPKGVMLTNDNFLTSAINNIIAYGLSPADICLHVMPFYHTMECSMAVCQFYVGGTNVIMENFDAHQFWNLVRDENITHITMVPTMLSQTIKAFDEGNYSKHNLKSISVGGQSVPVETMKQAVQILGENLIFVVFGLTEASPLITYLPKEDVVIEGDQAKYLMSVGKELFHCHVKVVDDKGNTRKPSKMGEIVVKGPNVMEGYWKNPDATEKSIKDGWLYTGDIGYLDEDGYLYIIDRKKDMIISGGENISPREIEEVLYTHEAVVECAVFGIPDKKWGEQVKAVVVVKEKYQSLENEIMEFCGRRLAKYKMPKSIDIVSSLPKDPVGKIQKRIIRKQYLRETREQIN